MQKKDQWTHHAMGFLMLAGCAVIGYGVHVTHQEKAVGSKAAVFCQGVDPNGQLLVVKYTPTTSGSARVWLLSQQSSHRTPSLEFKDEHGSLFMNNKGFTERLQLRISENEHFEITRGCGDVAMCSLEHKKYPSMSVYKEVRENLQQLQEDSERLQKEAGQAAAEVALARQDREMKKVQIQMARAKLALQQKKMSLKKLSRLVTAATDPLYKAGLEFVRASYHADQRWRDLSSSDPAREQFRKIAGEGADEPLPYRELKVPVASSMLTDSIAELAEAEFKAKEAYDRAQEMAQRLAMAHTRGKNIGLMSKFTELRPSQPRSWCPVPRTKN